jgi:hypothetical protein
VFLPAPIFPIVNRGVELLGLYAVPAVVTFKPGV